HFTESFLDELKALSQPGAFASDLRRVELLSWLGHHACDVAPVELLFDSKEQQHLIVGGQPCAQRGHARLHFGAMDRQGFGADLLFEQRETTHSRERTPSPALSPIDHDVTTHRVARQRVRPYPDGGTPLERRKPDPEIFRELRKHFSGGVAVPKTSHEEA